MKDSSVICPRRKEIASKPCAAKGKPCFSTCLAPRRKEIARKPCVAAWRPTGGLPSAAMSRRSCLGGLASEALPEGYLVTLKSRGVVGGR